MTRTDPSQLEAITVLIREGMDRHAIMKALRISRITYWRRLVELREIEEKALELIRAEA